MKKSAKLAPPCEDVVQLQILLRELSDIKHRMYDRLSVIGDKLKDNKYVNQDMVDIGFLCRETEDIMDDWRKDAKARRELAVKLLNVNVLEASLQDDSVSDVVDGTLATAKVDQGRDGQPPKHGTPEYSEFLRWAGINPESNGITTGLVKVSWTELSKFVTQCATDGKPLPPGVSKTWATYTASFTRRRAT